MNAFSEFHFLRPLWLTLLPVTAGLWWMVRRGSDPLHGWRAVMDGRLLSALTVGDSPASSRALIILLVGWLLAVISVAGPTWKPEPSPFADDPVPVMVLLQAGESMELTDLTPSRMERARLKVVDFARARRGQPMGLIAFAGTAHLVLPPTRDTDVVAAMAMEISPDIMPQAGDDPAAAIRLAASTLGDQRGSLVIVSDSVSGEASASLTTAAERIDLPICFLAVARADTPEMDDLTQAASAIDGQLIPLAADSDDVDALVRATARVPVSVTDAAEGVRWSEAGWWLVPVLTLLSLTGFRRTAERVAEETAA